VFDFRYHVASLTAVFVALVIGILVGVGLSGRGFVDDAERKNLEGQIDDLRAERDAAVDGLEEVEQRGLALDEYADGTYAALVRSRLRDARVALVFVGPVDQGVLGAVQEAIRDAGGTVVRMRAIDAPIDDEAVTRALASRPALRGLAPPGRREELGRALGEELVDGGQTPLWDALSGVLVVERSGPSKPPADGVVIARPARPQAGTTQALLTGLYRGLADSREPAVGVDSVAAVPPAVPAFRRGGLSTVDSIELSPGRLALVLLLAGGADGSYGVTADAVDGVLPPVPVQPASAG
jgi:hypothetical protein